MCNHLHLHGVEINLTLHSLHIGANDCTRWEAVQSLAYNDCKTLKQGMMETNRGTWDTVIRRWADVSTSLRVYSLSLCEQRLLLAMEVMRVCLGDNKSVAVWMLQACSSSSSTPVRARQQPETCLATHAGRCWLAVLLGDWFLQRITAKCRGSASFWGISCILSQAGYPKSG